MNFRVIRLISDKLILPVAILSFVIAGYFLTYHLFFLSLPIEDICYKKKGAEGIKFRYDGVVYFNGFRLNDGKSLTLKYRTPRVINLIEDKKIEFFIRIDPIGKHSREGSPGKLVYTQNGKTATIELHNATLQRIKVPWTPSNERNNVLKIKFLSKRPNNIPRIFLATNLRGVSLLSFFFSFSILGLTLVGFNMLRDYRSDIKLTSVILVCILVMYTIHSGAFISNNYFPGKHGKISSMVGEMKRLLSQGHFSETMYRNSGFVFIAAVSGIVEWELTRKGLLDTYPTTRYVMFVWVAFCLSYLITVMRKWIKLRAVLLFGLLYATFYPFIVDLYSPDADAYLIPLMTLMVALFIRLCLQKKMKYKTILALGAVFAAMLSVKITPIFIAVLIPLSLWVQTIIKTRSFRDRKTLIVLMVLFLCAFCGKFISRSFQHPHRNVGQSGIVFQKHVGWHILWAANGLYDHHSAHWFTKANDLRRQRVEEATGLSASLAYPHQSQLASDKLYKPGVIGAFKERPGYFLGTAFIRFYNHALTFFRYTYGGGRIWEPWLKDGFRGTKIISGEVVDGLYHEREMVRYGKMWKLSPLVFLTKIVQNEISMLADIIFIIFSIGGILLMRRPDFIMFFLGCVLAKFTFSIGFHSLVRYVNFVNVILLIGLSVTLETCIEVICNASRTIVKPAKASS